MPQLKVDLVVDDKGSLVMTGFGKNVDKVMWSSGAAVKSLSSVLAVAGAGMAAAVTAVGAMVTTSANQAREMDNLARLAKMGAQEFQEYAFATDQVGINAEKLADISKDVQDKLGDFIATGGGEFKDFFENIAPKVGLTAQELQKLSGPDVLVAVKKAMDDLNLSSAEQVFYLESLGNDASLLTPILENNGAALKREAARARELGIALNAVDRQKLLEAKRATDEATGALMGLKDKAAAEFAPGWAAVMQASTRWAISFKDEMVAAADGASNLLEAIFGAKTAAQEQQSEYQEKISAMLERRDRLGGLSEAEEKTLAVYRAQLVNLQSVIDLEAKRAATVPPLAPVVPAGAGGAAAPGAGTSTAAKDSAEYIDSWQHAYRNRSAIQSRSLDVLVQNEQALIDEGLAGAGSYVDSWELAYRNRDEIQSRSLAAMSDKEDTFGKNMANAMAGWASGFSSTLTDMVFDADASFGDILTSFGKMVTQMILQQSFVQPMVSGMMGFMGVTPSAHGNVFSGPGISAYSNQVVSKPTVFPFAKGIGLMGESGDEAIMPLTRMPSGNLGVEAVGGGGVVNNITVINNSDANASQSESQNSTGGIDVEILIDKSVARNVARTGSATNKAVRATTGSAPQLIRR
jgi:DNA polymerase/3'-5' exonuclease PolX